MLQEAFLSRAEHQLEAQLTEVISVFQNLPENVLLRPSSTGGWSIAECIAHLNSYAEYYQPRIKVAINASTEVSGPGKFKHSILGQYFIASMDSTKRQKKFKALKKHRPVEIGNPTTVVSTFIQHLENMLTLIRMARNKNLNKKAVPTSISSWIKISPGDAIQFLLTHNERHLQQAARNF
jgi:hypothetical protein